MPLRRLLAARFWLSLALLPSAAGAASLPHVGLIVSADAAERTLTVHGPDGAERTVQLQPGGLIAGAKGQRASFAELQAASGQVAAYLASGKDTAASITIAAGIEPKIERGWIRSVDRKAQALRFQAADGLMLTLRPAVNLGAVAAPGAAPTSADWAWFEGRLGQPLEVWQVKVSGLAYVWSVAPWATSRTGPLDEDPPASADPSVATPTPAGQ